MKNLILRGTHAAKKNSRQAGIYTTVLKTNLVDDITLRNPLWMKNVVTLKYTIIRNFIMIIASFLIKKCF